MHTRKNPPAGQRKRRCPAAYTPRLDCFSKIPYYLQLQQSLATIFFFQHDIAIKWSAKNCSFLNSDKQRRSARYRFMRKGFSMEDISFEDLGLEETVLAAVAAKGFEHPTPIQVLAIPRLLSGETNVIAKARTGTGKTAAFGLPLVQQIRTDTGTVQALVLAPTRELALQVCREIDSFATNGFPRTTAVYGGQSMGEQLRALKRGVEIVVGTPGRIQDHLERGTLDLSSISYFILDEADEMLDMGFIEDIEAIFAQANPDSRILLFSATMPPAILKIAANFMGDYEIVEEETHPEEPVLTEQKYWLVREQEKIEALIRLIDISPQFYGLVFTQTKNDADSVARALDERGYEAAALHGDIPQNQREKILYRFRTKKTRILAATDVAARGIDIEGLTHVVNYALPFDAPTYIHRIGRTGRAGAKGLAFTFVRPEERRKLEYLKSAVRKATKGNLEEAPIPDIDEVLDAKRSRIFTEMQKTLGFTEPAAPAEQDVLDTGSSFKTAPSDTAALDDAQAASPAPDNSRAERDAQAPDAAAASGEAATPADTAAGQPDSIFSRMAETLCAGRNPEAVLASVLEYTYGKQLDRSRYGHITPLKNFNQGRQLRLYVQLGRRDGYTPRGIAEYFSRQLHIPQRMVDRIDMAEQFCLVSLPYQQAMDMLDRSRRDRTLPHMHIDTKDTGGFAPRQRGRYASPAENSRRRFEQGRRYSRHGSDGGEYRQSSFYKRDFHIKQPGGGASLYKRQPKTDEHAY